ncbi:hypothetical protein BDN70DRAFT_406545 [Pholiota conissans]|uniref:Uncharacterized protein n=1 Tax=Pholiota conissans TaxID=109636 RepID=A0A9P5YNS2_9AGAR|nr:hypothetical protein BDN70DRAFT_406545 [Pholiota conissans]
MRHFVWVNKSLDDENGKHLHLSLSTEHRNPNPRFSARGSNAPHARHPTTHFHLHGYPYHESYASTVKFDELQLFILYLCYVVISESIDRGFSYVRSLSSTPPFHVDDVNSRRNRGRGVHSP